MLSFGSPDEKLAIDFHASISRTDRADGYIIILRCLRSKYEGPLRVGFGDARRCRFPCREGGESQVAAITRCRREDCFSVFQNVLVH